MDVAELFRRLSLGELSNISMGNDGAGTIKTADKPKIIMHANEALKKFFTRFVLRERTVILDTVEGISDYLIDSSNSVSNGGETTYVRDSVEDPYTDDLVRILDVTTSFGQDLTINNAYDELSVFTPRPNLIQVPYPLQGSALGINYQVKATLLVDGDETQVVDVPELLEKALTSFIAGQVYSGMNSQEALMKSQEHLARYEAICQEMEEFDLLSVSRASNYNKFFANGWR